MGRRCDCRNKDIVIRMSELEKSVFHFASVARNPGLQVHVTYQHLAQACLKCILFKLREAIYSFPLETDWTNVPLVVFLKSPELARWFSSVAHSCRNPETECGTHLSPNDGPRLLYHILEDVLIEYALYGNLDVDQSDEAQRMLAAWWPSVERKVEKLFQ